MGFYAAVSAVRIQAWLSRTPRLSLVRGASKALTQATRRDTLSSSVALPDGVRFDNTSPEIAGVVVLVGDSLAALCLGVERTLVRLAQALPGVEWTGWAVEASSYVEAVDTTRTRGEPALATWRQTPSILDHPLLTGCSQCSFEAATASAHFPDGQVGLGPDCTIRHEAGARSASEKDFKDFDALAQAGRGASTVGRRDALNHLATITADGNKVGDFFRELAKASASWGEQAPTIQCAFSGALDAASRAAATAACHADGVRIGIEHFVGGDDIFLSVAAAHAWTSVATLALVFEDHFRAAVRDAVEGLGPETSDEVREALLAASERVSLAIGVTFSQTKHPLDDARDWATKAEKRAKAFINGTEAAVCWVDLTVESSLPRDRGVLVTQLVRELADHDHAVLTMGSSMRSMLIRQLRPDPAHPLTDVQRADAIRAWTERINKATALEPYLPVKSPTEAQAAEALGPLAGLVDRARWWPTTAAVKGEE